MFRFLLLLFFFSNVSSLDNSVAVDGTIDEYRFVMLSQNTLSGDVDSVADTGSDEFLMGSIEINIFNNTDTGVVYIQNSEYKDSKFFCLGKNSDDQIEMRIKASKNTDGTTADPYRTVTPADGAVLRDTTSDTSGLTFNEKIIIEFYTIDSTSNVLTSGTTYGASYSFYWLDS